MSENFVKVAETKEIAPSSMKAVEVEGEKVCIINTEGNYYAIGNICTHVGGPLDEGTLKDMKLNVLGTVPNLMLGLVSQLSLLLCDRFPSMK